jgi:hypothetical protein
VTTQQFVDLAERISGQDLGALFETWLFTPGKPDVAGAVGPSARSLAAETRAPGVADMVRRQAGAAGQLRR